MTTIQFFRDTKRHLVCTPYTEENLHIMAKQLNIKRISFHKGKAGKAHYDIPITRQCEIQNQCTIVSSKDIINIMKSNQQILNLS